MEETKIVIVVECKVPLSEADMRYLEADMARRLQTTLVQKLASITFKREPYGNNQEPAAAI